MKLGAFLAKHRDRIVRERLDVQYEEYDPTYGAQVRTRSIDIIDFDELCSAIDEFSETFKDARHP